MCFQDLESVGMVIKPITYRMWQLCVSLILPLLWVFASYASIRRALTKQRTVRLSVHVERKAEGQHLRKASTLLGYQILTLCIGWFPFMTYWFIYAATDLIQNSCQSQVSSMKWHRIAILFGVINAAADPLIYLVGVNENKKLVCEAFRKVFFFKKSSKTDSIPLQVKV